MDFKKYFIPDWTFWQVFRLGHQHKNVRPWLKSLFWNSPAHYWMMKFWPTMGTLSILFGVHQFLWHPFTVARAWRYLYGRWPTGYQWIAIFCHDLGYWGKRAMDSPEGQTHPEFGAKLAMYLAYGMARLRLRSKDDATVIGARVYKLCLFHSTHYAQSRGGNVSPLYLPDKACVLFDPPWFYLLRGKLSGEVYEYTWRENNKLANSPDDKTRGVRLTPERWLENYRAHIREKAIAFFETEERRKRRDMINLLHRAMRRPGCECDICTEKK